MVVANSLTLSLSLSLSLGAFAGCSPRGGRAAAKPSAQRGPLCGSRMCPWLRCVDLLAVGRVLDSPSGFYLLVREGEILCFVSGGEPAPSSPSPLPPPCCLPPYFRWLAKIFAEHRSGNILKERGIKVHVEY